MAEDKANKEKEDLVETGDSQIQASITQEMKQSYINYAMSVIVARALPDVRDGLKPVQRRILYTMHKMNVQPGSAYKKVARIVGETMGKYHPHGDSSISDALVRMGQDFSMRYTLVDGQGNYGSIDGDPAAAMRYIEARLDKNGAKILEDLDKKTVDFAVNYDGTESEPTVLPAGIPNLLINGTEGIAVGMATKIPPHNLNEIVDATVHMMDNENVWNADEDSNFSKVDYNTQINTVSDIETLPKNRFQKFSSTIEVKDLLKIVQGPDFPSACEIYDQKEIQQIYETGKGRVLMRAVSEIEEVKGGKYRIIVTQLPYQVNKSTLIAKIAQLHKDKKVEGITDLRDESNREGIRIVIELKRDSNPKTVENRLYKYTDLQKAFNANVLALVDGDPKLLPLKRILELFITHRQQIITRRNEFELAKLKEREHILEGLMIALDNIDEVIKIIRESKDVEVARAALMERFKLSEIQSQAILDMRLSRLAALERLKIEEEYKEVKKKIKAILIILNTPSELINVIKRELLEAKEKLGDPRRTKVFKGKVGEINEEDLIVKEETLITISKQGYIKRTKIDNYQQQKRGGVGKKAVTTKDTDSVMHIMKTSTHDQILFFSNKGKVYSLKAYEIPEYSRQAKGLPLVNIIQMPSDELITSVLARSESGGVIDEDVSQEGEVKSENKGLNYKFLMMATKNGIVKKTEIAQFDNIRSTGLIAIKLDEEDELIWVKPTTGDSEVLLVTRNGKSIHFLETDVRDTGRSSRGVRGIRLTADNIVITMDVVRKKEDFVLTVSKKGYGKMTKISDFNIQNRGGSGIFASRVTSKTGELISARLLDHPHKELLIMSELGQAVRIETDNLPVQGRQTSGVKLMKIKSGDNVAAIAIV